MTHPNKITPPQQYSPHQNKNFWPSQQYFSKLLPPPPAGAGGEGACRVY